MQLIDIRNEVLAKGFDPNLFGIARINQYINDGYALIARRVQYFVDEDTYTFQTTANTATVPQPADLAVVRSLDDTDRGVELESVNLRDIDRSTQSTGTPSFYALDGANIHLYPTPDSGAHNLRLRYWKMPAPLVNDTDVPNIPADWHHILHVYGTWMCYEAEDDPSMGQYWQKRFQDELAEFTADSRFPSSDLPAQARGMWDSGPVLSNTGWTLYTGY